MAAAVTAVRRATRVPMMIDSTDPDRLRGGASACSRQAGPQLRQPRGRRSPPRPGCRARAPIRRGGRRRLHRRPPHRGDGAHRGARRWRWRARLLERSRGVRPAAARDLRGPARLPRRHRRPDVPRRGRRDGAGAPAHQGATRRVRSTILGISNVSFGLPAAGREVLNAVFLHHCLAAGLDAAIVNTEQLVRFPTLDPAASASRRGCALHRRPNGR